MSELTITEETDLTTRFPQSVTHDERKGYEGFIVNAADLIEVATFIRDEAGYDYLSSLTGVDYLPDEKLEVVYHFFKSTGGGALTLKTQVPRDNPIVPSLVPVYPGADFQEREAYDLLGIQFENHPDLRRILMWEGFNGYPLRKDWHEAYYEEDTKPYKNRWPDGHITRAEDNNPFHKNVEYPPGFDPDTWEETTNQALYDSVRKSIIASGSDIKTDTILVNMGPQHPSTHGVFRIAVALDGETIKALKPVMGYLHRNHEKIGERNTYLQNMPFTDRLDYLSSMSNNFGYAIAVEN